jgi:hypothetical protein
MEFSEVDSESGETEQPELNITNEKNKQIHFALPTENIIITRLIG